jgi:transposase InsO family protein
MNTEILNKVFYGENHMASLKTFMQNLNRLGYSIPHAEIATFYNSQPVVQVFRKNNAKRVVDRHIVAYHPFERVQMDSMYVKLKNSTLVFVNIVDVFSKFAFSRMFTIAAQAQALPSSKAVTVLDEFVNQIKEYKIGILYTDWGPEFLKDFTLYCNEHLIVRVLADPGDKNKMSIVERFNQTLRLYIEKNRYTSNKRFTNQILQSIMNSYNNVTHAKLHYTPNEILEDEDKQKEIEQHFKELSTVLVKNALPIGSSVRVLIDRGTFGKRTSQVWSSDIYKIASFAFGRYTLDDISGKFPRNELFPIK